MKQIGRTVCYCEVDYYEINELVQNIYGVEYNCVCDMEWSNDSSHNMYINKSELDRYDKNKLQEFTEGRSPGFMLYILMNDMCNKNIIPAEKYLVHVCW